jgi:hypothetical protein
VSLAGEPYLSVVVTARNDDHGGNLLSRMQIFVAGWIAQARRYGIPSELIIVEWNPLPDRPRLIDVLRWPEDPGPCEVRFIEVPHELHARYPHGDALPLYQMIGKNAGIRRARGQFVLATNIDVLFSDELAEYLAARRLESGRMYRIDRHDAMSDVPVDAPVEEQLAYCGTHLIRVNRREGSFNVTPDGGPVLEARDVAPLDSGIVFGRGWYALEHYIPPQVFRWAGEFAELLLEDPPEPGAALVLDIEPGPSTGGLPLELEIEVEGQPPVRQTVNRRQRMRLRFASPSPKRLRLRTRDGGVRVYGDPRPLNYRLFHVDWERKRGAKESARSLQVTLHPVSWRTTQGPTRWRELMHLIRKLAEGGPLVRVIVPVSPGLRRRLRFYLDCGGLSGILRHPLASLRAYFAGARHGSSKAPSVRDPHQEAPDFLHTNACGDFTLMAREHWFDLRGYPEMDLFSMNLDSLFCFAAHYGGAREEMLAEPMRIYHVEHGSGSGWTPEGQTKLFERIAAQGLSYIGNEEVLAMAAEMRRWETPMIFNHQDWGLAAFALKETVVRGRG